MEKGKGQVPLFEEEEKEKRPLPEGRDEMNLAEFPLAALSDRIPEGKKSLVFEDRIWDKGTKQWVDRKLTITGTEEEGLPTFKDDEVLTVVEITRTGPLEELVWVHIKDTDNERKEIHDRREDPDP